MDEGSTPSPVPIMPYKNKDKQREYQRRWLGNRRAEFFAGKSCVVCGSSENLELDHIDRSTKVTHKIWGWSKEKQEAELAKCQVLCYDCHKTKTSNENIVVGDHGTRNRWEKGCRCVECKKANTKSRNPNRK